MFNFHPHPLVRGGHLQTLCGFYLPAVVLPERAERHHVVLDDRDTLVLHDDWPESWRDGGPTAMLIHGLAGCHRSAYLQRIAAKLVARGVRTFRMDMRGCGAGEGLARGPTHCGRSGDAAAALERIAQLCPDSPTVLVGFSLGGAIALNLVAELGDARCGNLAAVLAVCPPVDLPANSIHFERWIARLYDHFFARRLWRQVLRRAERFPDARPVDLSRRPRRLRQVDEWVTAPLGGFASADEYYRLASAGPKLTRVEVPTVILAAEDDPVVPAELLRRFDTSATVRIVITPSGGHLGYIGRPNGDPDYRWLDWRVVDWVTGRLEAGDRRLEWGRAKVGSVTPVRR